MTDLSCKCLCRPSCFSRSSHSINSPTVSGLANDQPQPASQNQLPDAEEPPQSVGDGVNILVEEKADAPTKTEETTRESVVCDGENGTRGTDGVDGEDEPQVQIPLKSSLKRHSGTEDARKGRVKWMDILGKDLVEVQEFESSDSEDLREHSIIRSCGCVIQ